MTHGCCPAGQSLLHGSQGKSRQSKATLMLLLRSGMAGLRWRLRVLDMRTSWMLALQHCTGRSAVYGLDSL
jgi:hypothetical protein